MKKVLSPIFESFVGNRQANFTSSNLMWVYTVPRSAAAAAAAARGQTAGILEKYIFLFLAKGRKKVLLDNFTKNVFSHFLFFSKEKKKRV